MTYWNYRIMRREYSRGKFCYAIHEVFYSAKGKAWGCTKDEVSPSGETLKGLEADFKLYAQALRRPVLDYKSPHKEIND